jgi:uncharacterized protein
MNIADILKDYQNLPEYSGLMLVDVNQVSLFGDRPMNVAATRGSIDEMEVLVSHGARVSDAGEHGYTPLHNAVEQGQLDAVLWLLAHGADTTVRNKAGETPATLARILREEQIASTLEKVAGTIGKDTDITS